MNKRPVFLDLFKIYLPVTALVSILHRISGLILLIFAPVWVAALYGAVYNVFVECIFYFKVIMAISAVLYFYHLLAGGRHILAEICHCHSLQSSRSSAVWVLLIWLAVSALFLVRVFL